jgi:hypothetical protein
VGAVIVAAATPSKRFKDWRRVIMPLLSRQFVSILGLVDRKTSFLELWTGEDNTRFARRAHHRE